MLTPQQLEEFAEYMRSGELEKDFADGCEHDRYYLLEMLEKLMDMGDLAGPVERGAEVADQPAPRHVVQVRSLHVCSLAWTALCLCAMRFFCSAQAPLS